MKKSLNNQSRSKLPLIIAVVVIFLGALYLLSKSLVSPQVALIETGSTPPNCQTLVESLSFSKECSEGYFQSATYTCKNGTTSNNFGRSEKCYSADEIIASVQTSCGQICEAVVKSPVPSALPSASCVPNPCKEGAMCKLMALPDGQSYCPQSSTTPPTQPRPTNTPVPSGCYYQEVKCIQAPCDKILVCNPSPTPIPTPTYSTAPSATPSANSTCGKQLSTWKYRESCGNGSYRYVDFNCIGDKDTQTMGGISSCEPESVWLNNAKNTCRAATCTTLSSPTPTPNVVVSQPAPKQDYWSCYRDCRSSRKSFIACYRSCRMR